LTLAALALVLGSAAVHALWNALLADADDTHATTAVMLVSGVVLFAPVAALTWDVDASALPYVLASGTLELVYFGLLATAYSRADLTFVYPIARGSAPVIVLLVSVVVLGVAISGLQAAGVLAVAAGVLLVRGLHRVGDLHHDVRHLVRRKRTVAARVLLEQLARRPFDREEVHTGRRFADLDRSHDVRVRHPLAIVRLADTSRDRRAIVAQFLAQHFDGDCAVVRMLGAKNSGCAAFADFRLERVSGKSTPDQILPWHGREPNDASEGGQGIDPHLLDKESTPVYIGPRKSPRLAQHRSGAGSIHLAGGSEWPEGR